MTARATTLILGWGNPGRLDDGLGPAFIERVAERGLHDVALDSDYQLTMEDAAEVARYERVVFVDAARSGSEPFGMRRIQASRNGSSFSTHSVAPGAVLSLCRDLFHAEPEAWLLGIRGYDFDEFGECLSGAARANLSEAVDFICASVETGRFREAEEPTTRKTDRKEDPCPSPSG